MAPPQYDWEAEWPSPKPNSEAVARGKARNTAGFGEYPWKSLVVESKERSPFLVPLL